MKIGIIMLGDNKARLITAIEYSNLGKIFYDGDLRCPSCGTRLKLINKEGANEEFIAGYNTLHNFCKKQYSNNFYNPLELGVISKLPKEDINKYLKILCEEYENRSKLPVYEVIKRKITDYKYVDFRKINHAKENYSVVETIVCILF